MKKAREYAIEWSLNNNNDQIDKQDFIAAVKQIQEEAIRETVKECNKYAEIRVVENALIEEGETYSSYDDGVFTFFVDDKSILSIADKLIKEL